MTTNQHPLRFDSRVIIVTGAGGGMGKEHAKLLASLGARVVVNDIGSTSAKGNDSSAGPAEAVVKEIVESGGEAVASTDSVATPEGAQAIIAKAVDTWGRLDGLIHNAGIGRFAPVEETNLDDYKAVMAVNLDGALYLTMAAWPIMKAQKYGRIVYVTSGGGLVGVPFNTPYAMAKTGMLGLMNVTRIEGAEFGINVNMLGVAAFTRMTKGMFGDDENALKTEAWWEKYLRSDMVSPVASWLVHEANQETGIILNAAGGHVSKNFLAETRGYTNLNLTIDDVHQNLKVINEEADYHVMRSGQDINSALTDDLVDAGAESLGLSAMAINLK